MVTELYATVRRVVNDGTEGPWMAEVIPQSGGTLFLQMDSRPRAAAGDDIYADVDVARQKSGQNLAIAREVNPSRAAAMTRLRGAFKGARVAKEYGIIKSLATAERSGDIRAAVGRHSISMLRPVLSADPAKDEALGMTRPAPRLVFRKDPNGFKGYDQSANGTTSSFHLFFGGVNTSSYSHLFHMAGASALYPRFDISPVLAQEYLTVREFACSIDDHAHQAGVRNGPHYLRRLETFADAFAVLELALGGRSLKELELIVIAREAGLVGQAFDRRNERTRLPQLIHLSGAACRKALQAAKRCLKDGIEVTPAQVLKEAWKIADSCTLSKKAMTTLADHLNGVSASGLRTADGFRRVLYAIAAENTDPLLKQTAKSLAGNISKGFFGVDDLRVKANADKVTAIHRRSTASFLRYIRESDMPKNLAELFVTREAEAWKPARSGGARGWMEAVRAALPGGAPESAMQRRILGMLSRQKLAITQSNDARQPETALRKLPHSSTGDGPNPWSMNTAQRLAGCARHAEAAFRAAAFGYDDMTAWKHQTAFTSSMRGFNAFHEAVLLRDVAKDSPQVVALLEKNSGIEQEMKLLAQASYSDLMLPLGEPTLLRIQSVAKILNPKVELPPVQRPEETRASLDHSTLNDLRSE